MNPNYKKMWKDLEETLTKIKISEPSYEIIAHQILQLMNNIQNNNTK